MIISQKFAPQAEYILQNADEVESIPNPGVDGAFQITWRLNGYDMQGSSKLPHPTRLDDIHSMTFDARSLPNRLNPNLRRNW